jgi:uncharacterized protein YbjT (DUF2867 family)
VIDDRILVTGTRGVERPVTTERARARPTLIAVGTGKTGRRVAERLTARGLPTRVGSRSGHPPFDWADPETWAGALYGVESAYLSYYPDLALPGAMGTVRSFTDLAVLAGVRRLVLLSGRGEDEAQRAERVVQEAGVDWTIVRCARFSQNFSEGFLLEPLLTGEIALPAGSVPEPFVDVDDIADVGVAALTEDSHAGEVYELTGPRLLTFAEAVAEIGEATGRGIRYVPLSVEEYASRLDGDVPSETASLMTHWFGEVLDGRNAYVTDGVYRALGRKPRDFGDYARAAAASGVWSPLPAGHVDAA